MRKRITQCVAARLEVDVAGALVEGVLPQPVDHLHHALVVGVELLVAAAQLDELLEARDAEVSPVLMAARTERDRL